MTNEPTRADHHEASAPPPKSRNGERFSDTLSPVCGRIASPSTRTTLKGEELYSPAYVSHQAWRKHRGAAVAGKLVLSLTLIGSLGAASAACGQVAYQPYSPAVPTPYGYPVPYGFLQPNETLGTSPAFEIFPYGSAPAVRVVQRCQYPDGWNITDFSRDVNGIPSGIDHTCPVPSSVRARY